jgi:hypothetical protein
MFQAHSRHTVHSRPPCDAIHTYTRKEHCDKFLILDVCNSRADTNDPSRAYSWCVATTAAGSPLERTFAAYGNCECRSPRDNTDSTKMLCHNCSCGMRVLQELTWYHTRIGTKANTGPLSMSWWSLRSATLLAERTCCQMTVLNSYFMRNRSCHPWIIYTLRHLMTTWISKNKRLSTTQKILDYLLNGGSDYRKFVVRYEKCVPKFLFTLNNGTPR